MTQQRTYSIRCPQCSQEQDVELYESLNVQTSPELKEQLMNNQLNAVVCEQCDSSFRVDKPLLYSDPVRNLLIHVIPVSSDRVDEGQRQFSEWMGQLNSSLPQGVDAPHLHLVFSRIELVERIFMLEAGLDERVIEYIKHLVYSQNMDRVDPTTKALLFDAQDSTDEALCFVVQDVAGQQLESVLEYSRQAYDALCEMFDQDEQTPSLIELFPGPYISARALLLGDSATRAGGAGTAP